MSRWIDAEWLLNFFVDIPNNFTLTIGNLRATVNDAPSIDIVRCKECRYKDMEICPMHRLVVAGVRKYDDYCSYGERREP